MRQVCIFSGSSHPKLVDAITERLGCRPSPVGLKKFSNGETSVEIQTSVRDHDVFIVQSGSSQTNDNVIELLIMINACKGGSARSITAVMPYFPYSRQSKKKTHRGAITARMLANLMAVAGVNHVITVDLHASQSQGFFKCPVDNLVGEPLLSKWLRQNITDWKDAVVVSKNPGGTKRVTSMADALNLSFGIVTTDRRRQHGSYSLMNSVVLESMGADGTNDRHAPEGYVEEAELQIISSGREREAPPHYSGPPSAPRTNGETHAARARRPSRHRATTATFAPALRTRLTNGASGGEAPLSPSPLSRSTRLDSIATERSVEDGLSDLSLHRFSTAAGIEQVSSAEDGYEEAAGDEDGDELARDVITGRLIHGHIVDDELPSPSMSVQSESFRSGPHGQRGSRSSEEEQLPDAMMQSFMSTASSRMQAPLNGLGGTGDATASDEEEEEALKDPDVESTVTLVGNVRDRPVIIIDDIIDKAGSWIAAAETVVKRGGATKVYCMATHGIFGDDSLRELDLCDEIEAVIVTDAFPIPDSVRQMTKKLVVLDVSGLLAEAIRRNHHGESISLLYQHFN
ncbi:hypothetical protein LTR62_004378 [Meristemomyces frigidus]|uniref:Ribose-phosphate pyrophosphokinase 1 n=1 Tax=Meristemomyces frigidus TaxID=1508187 RepID=A0AAN7YRD9_9PEZI|nr:hypothetical protein LTR62_004378 [Meristemomyces frigidus]